MSHCEVRVALFDTIKKVYLSNFVIIGAKPNKEKNIKGAPQSGMEVTETFDWEIRNELKSFIATTDMVDSNLVHFLIEFVAFVEVGSENEKYLQ